MPRRRTPLRRTAVRGKAAAAARARLCMAVAATLLGGALVAASGAGASPPIDQKRAQARAILAQIQQLDGEVGAAAERWNGANYELARISAALEQARADLRRAKVGVRVSQARVNTRLRELYIEGEPSSAAEVILGAKSLTEIVDLLDAAGRVADQDSRIARNLKGLRLRVASRERQLAAARVRQAVLVQRRAAERAGIEQRLGERKRLLASVRSEVAQLEAREAARQAELRRRAAAELERQLAAAAAVERARAEQAAAQQRAAAAAAASPAPVASPAQVAAQPAPAAPDAAGGAASTSPVEGAGAPPPPTVDGAVSSPPPVDGASSPPTGSVSTPSPSPSPPPADAGRGAQVVAIAMRYLGVPYRWGAASPSAGFDCSGLTMYVFAQIGVSLPHYAAAQFTMGAAVSRAELQPGDLVFFRGLGHMGMYIGGDSFIHAPRTGDVVKISSLSESYYASNWVGARRVL